MNGEKRYPALHWLPSSGSWEEAVLSWPEQVQLAFRRVPATRQGPADKGGDGPAQQIAGSTDPASLRAPAAGEKPR
jgi:hypothetical protein